LRYQNRAEADAGRFRGLLQSMAHYKPPNILNSPAASAMSIYVIRAFIRLRDEFAANSTLEKRLAIIEKTLISHDTTLRDVIQKIRPLLLPPNDIPKRRIGFHTND
jgi:hypothetical protein